MRTCQSCSLKDGKCLEICSDVKAFLKGKRNYKTTYVNKEIGLNEAHANTVCESLADYLDSSGSFTEKFGHLLPMIEKIVEDYGTKRQAQVWELYLHEHMSLGYIATLLYMKRQSVHEVLYGRRGQGGLIRKIQKHLRKSGKLPALN